MFVYLFEAKSIQSYLFQSGKLKDVISASERLDRLIDNHPSSVLANVIEQCQLDTDLLTPHTTQHDQQISFVRCKGGAFYAWSQSKTPLQQLRSTWTLTVQQLFPGLTFCDALCEDASLQQALQQGHAALAAARNLPHPHYPLSTAPCVASPRTGLAAVPLSAAAQREVAPQANEGEQQIDLDTELHRQCYRFLGLRDSLLLQKFSTNIDLPADLQFPLDTSAFYNAHTEQTEDADVRDLALIHIDGNGLGKQLRALRKALENQPDDVFSTAFRQFSDALAKATERAAAEATQWLYQTQLKQQENTPVTYLAMRPLVLGGDDITLLCRADLALGYAKYFCRAFQTHSAEQLKGLHTRYLKGSADLLPYLTASGGILYHKANHPFMLCHHLVEGLCSEAKTVTKAIPTALPAALSFYRISKALAEDIRVLRAQSQQWLWQGKPLQGALPGYLLTENDGQFDSSLAGPSFIQLERVRQFLSQKVKGNAPLPLSINKFRQMATELSRDNSDEAMRIYDRALSQLTPTQRIEWDKHLVPLMPAAQHAEPNWFWSQTDDMG
ncbi:MAG: Cas10/Cmr2 second palm domain-containing protein, partial [Shewanella sp.]